MIYLFLVEGKNNGYNQVLYKLNYIAGYNPEAKPHKDL